MRKNPAPWYSRAFKMRRADGGMIMGGILLASASSYFPYYVYNNGSQFGPPEMIFTGRAQADLEAQTRDELIRLAAQGFRPIRDGSVPIDASIDPITTASIDSTTSNQELNFELIFASLGTALIRDGEDIIPVSRGSRLPDGSTVKSVRQRKGQWQIVTSNDAILSVKN